MKRILLALLSLSLLSIWNVGAQESEGRALFEADHFNITAQAQFSPATIDSQATVKVTNRGTAAARQLTLKINKKAKVSAVSVEGATAQFREFDDRFVAILKNVAINLPKSVPVGGSTTITVSYSFPVEEASATAALTPGDTLLLPESHWFPVVNSIFSPHGADYAPFTLTVTLPQGEQAISGGALKSESPASNATTYVYEQTLPGQPFLVAGHYDKPVTGKAAGVEVYLPKGLNAASRQQIDQMIEEAGRILDYYSKLFGAKPATPIRIIGSSRINSFASPSSLIFNLNILRRDILVNEMVESLASGLARNWIGGQIRFTDRGWGVLIDGLPRYLSALYFGERFGADAGKEAFERYRRVYAPLGASKRDLHLIVQTPLYDKYYASVLNKGPLVWRMVEREMGRDKLLSAIKGLLSPEQGRTTFDEFRKTLIAAGGKGVETILFQWIDKVVDPDLMIGIPRPTEKGITSALRNFGTGDVKVDVLAITDKGERLIEQATIPSEGLSEVHFNTANKIVSVEVDPDKIVPQINYDNDAQPKQLSGLTVYNEGYSLYVKQDLAGAEAKFREAAKLEPQHGLPRVWLGRVLALQGKTDEAMKELNAALEIQPPLAAVVAWANITLGELAQAKGESEKAIGYFKHAVLMDAEVAATTAARAGLIKAETAANKLPPVEESVRSFISQLDKAINSGNAQALAPLIVRTNAKLKKFMNGVAINKPQWTSEILRAEALDADLTAVDVNVKAREGDRSFSGTALLILRRAGSGWLLDNIPEELFNVK